MFLHLLHLAQGIGATEQGQAYCTDCVEENSVRRLVKDRCICEGCYTSFAQGGGKVISHQLRENLHSHAEYNQ